MKLSLCFTCMESYSTREGYSNIVQPHKSAAILKQVLIRISREVKVQFNTINPISLSGFNKSISCSPHRNIFTIITDDLLRLSHIFTIKEHISIYK